MRQTDLGVREALELLERQPQRFPYQIIYRLSGVELGDRMDPVDLEEATEARFFGPEAELRFFEGRDGLTALLVEDGPEDLWVDRQARLLPRFGSTLTSRQYVAFDQDGQGYIALVRLLDWKGGASDAG